MQHALSEYLRAKAAYSAGQAQYRAMRNHSTRMAGRLGAMGGYPGQFVAPPPDSSLLFQVAAAQRAYLAAKRRYELTP